MTTKIYIVTDGDYSDYGIRAVFSTKEKAEEYCKHYQALSKYNEPQIEEWVMDMDLSPVERGLKSYRFFGMKDRSTADLSDNIEPEFVNWFGYDEKYLHGRMWSDSEERVVKAVAEKVAQILAMDLWGKTEALEMFFGVNHD